VGDLQLALERSGVLRNTLFIFTSDHGPWLVYGDHAGSTAGLRGGKGSSFEGGVRVPFLASWPGVIRAGSQCDQPLMNIDLLPSIAAWIGADLPARAIDGRDVRHLLSGVGAAGDGGTAYYFWGPGNELEAMRLGRWKLHFVHRFRSVPEDFAGSGGEAGRYRYGQSIALSLFDLAMDPNESRPVEDDFPEVLKRLQQLAHAKRGELGDALTGVSGFGRRQPARDL
jgi:arylsulfatase A-like enzyme